MKQKSILFVCTGNVFRSVSGEYAFKQYLSDNGISNWKVSSAGIIAECDGIYPKMRTIFAEKGVKNVRHKQKKTTKKLLDEYDIVIGMAQNHIDFMKSKLNFHRALLFNELALKKKTSIWDVEDEVKHWRTNPKGVEKKVERTVRYIFKKTPELFENICKRYYIFSDFVSGQKKHGNGFPFIKLYETKSTISFMSIDIPSKEDGHILVIPKQRYADFSEIPKNVLNELIQSIQKIGTAIKKNHGGYNILLNNGSDAGQYIFHTHFHIIPRNYNDGIKIELWDHKKLSQKDFINLNNKLIKQIKSV
jgi:histidine triad (HIT) family protein